MLSHNQFPQAEEYAKRSIGCAEVGVGGTIRQAEVGVGGGIRQAESRVC